MYSNFFLTDKRLAKEKRYSEIQLNQVGFFEKLKNCSSKISYNRYIYTRFLNLFLLEAQIRLKPIKAFAFPRSVNIDITNVCNANCQLCPTGLKRRHRLGYMKYEDFIKIIDTIKHKVFSVGLYVWGEPLLHKHIVRMVEYCKKCSIKTIISTNLIEYDDGKYEELFKAEIGKIIVSLHGISQSSYEAYRPGFDYEKVLTNLEKLVKLRKNMKAFNTEINLAFAVTASNEQEVPFLYRFCVDNNFDTLDIIPASLNLRFLKRNKELNNQEWINNVRTHFNKWEPKNRTYTRPLHKTLYATPKLLTSNKLLQQCLDPWQTICINWKGDITPCCGSYDYYEDSLGNVFETDIIKIWNNDKYVNSRLRLKNKSHDKNTLCSKCIGGAY